MTPPARSAKRCTASTPASGSRRTPPTACSTRRPRRWWSTPSRGLAACCCCGSPTPRTMSSLSISARAPRTVDLPADPSCRPLAGKGAMSERIAVYPGSFDPIHNGHLDLIERCRPMYDRLVVAVLRNEAKRALFSVDERLEIIRELIGERRHAGDRGDSGACEVQSFSGLLVDFMDEVGARIVVRGLRAVTDFEYELQMALMNRRLNPRVET